MESAILSSLSGLVGVMIGVFITLRKLKYERADKYFMAALEQKIKAHQEAYNLSWDLPSAAHKSETDFSYFQKCEKWYRENCLYLEPEARYAFFKAYRTAWIYKDYLNDWKETKDSTDLKIAWNEITSAKSIIEKNVSKTLIEPSDLKKEEYDYKGKVGDKK